jgi:hypothetical protein
MHGHMNVKFECRIDDILNVTYVVDDLCVCWFTILLTKTHSTNVKKVIL